MKWPFKNTNYIKMLMYKRREFIRNHPFFQKNALNFLNISQFLGVVNDNIFKFLTLYLLIDLRGVQNSSEILFMVGTIYVLPFLFFSNAAGVVADKFSKQKIIVFLKGLEVVITILGVLAFWFSSAWACYTLLFLLSFQSAAFGPPKYSIIPEIVHFEKISKANGIITSFTYLAMILGTFLASSTTQLTDRNFVACSMLCVVIAILGFAASLFIPYTIPTRTTKRINVFFIREIFHTLKFCSKRTHLLSAIMGSAFFLYVGAFFQLNIIPYAMETLGISEVGGGYLFLTVAIGIATGSIIAGRISKNRVELGLACLAGTGLWFFLYVLSLSPGNLAFTVFVLVSCGLVGGMFIVPFDSYIQTHSPKKQRGQIVAASNFLSFCGVLLAPITLYFFNGILNFKAYVGFFFMAFFVMVVSLILLFHFSPLFLNFLGRKLFLRIYDLKVIKSPFSWKSKPLLIMPESSMTKALLISSQAENLHFFIFRNKRYYLDFFYRLFSNVTILYLKKLNKPALEIIKSKIKSHKTPCLLLAKSLKLEEASLHPEAIGDIPALYIHTERASTEALEDRHKKKQMVFKFSETPQKI